MIFITHRTLCNNFLHITNQQRMPLATRTGSYVIVDTKTKQRSNLTRSTNDEQTIPAGSKAQPTHMHRKEEAIEQGGNHRISTSVGTNEKTSRGEPVNCWDKLRSLYV